MGFLKSWLESSITVGSMCLEGLMRFDMLDEGIGNEALCATGYSDTNFLIKELGGRHMAMFVSRI